MIRKQFYLTKVFLAFVFCLLAFFSSSQVVFAQTPTPPPDIMDSDFLWEVNPLTITGNSLPWIEFIEGRLNVGKFSTPAGFMNELLPYLFSLAGIILFIMIVWGGFEMILGANDTKSFDSGKQRATSALIGFTLLFCTYWIAQIVQYIFGVNILGGA